MKGVVACATAIASPAGEKATSLPPPVGSVAGLAYLIPKPVPTLQGYTEMKGVPECATAMTLPAGLKATPLPEVPGNVAGSVYLVPKPVLTFQG